jgi:hypothetical protein
MAGIRGACSIRVGQTASPEVGTKPAISKGLRRKMESARPGRAIPENEREEMEFLFSTAIADVSEMKKSPPARPTGLPSRSLET